MGWASYAIEDLKSGRTVKLRPKGESMKGLIKSGSLVLIRPLSKDDILNKNDIVLCKVKGKEYLHLVGAIKGNQYLIQNNLGHINGWVSRKNIYGIYVKSLST